MKFVNSSTEDLDWEGAVLLSQEGVNLLPSNLVDGRTDGPNEAEGEPELHYRTQMFSVRGFHLKREGKNNNLEFSYSRSYYCNCYSQHNQQ